MTNDPLVDKIQMKIDEQGIHHYDAYLKPTYIKGKKIIQRIGIKAIEHLDGDISPTGD